MPHVQDTPRMCLTSCLRWKLGWHWVPHIYFYFMPNSSLEQNLIQWRTCMSPHHRLLYINYFLLNISEASEAHPLKANGDGNLNCLTKK